MDAAVVAFLGKGSGYATMPVWPNGPVALAFGIVPTCLPVTLPSLAVL